jgi:SAM-dependent methyltransferase
MNTEHEIDQALGHINGGRVLDVATGPGSMITWMIDALASYENITAIDTIDPATRDLGEMSVFNRADVQFISMDAQDMTFRDNAFNTVTIGNSLHHMDDPASVLIEMMRVLAPGGAFIFREMYRDNQTEEQLSHVQVHHWMAAIDTALGVPHHETFTRSQIEGMIEGLGLRALDFYDYADLHADPFHSENLDHMRSNITHYLERAQHLPSYPALAERAEALRARLDQIGLRWATTLIAIGRR